MKENDCKGRQVVLFDLSLVCQAPERFNLGFFGWLARDVIKIIIISISVIEKADHLDAGRRSKEDGSFVSGMLFTLMNTYH